MCHLMMGILSECIISPSPPQCIIKRFHHCVNITKYTNLDGIHLGYMVCHCDICGLLLPEIMPCITILVSILIDKNNRNTVSDMGQTPIRISDLWNLLLLEYRVIVEKNPRMVF